QNPPPRSQFGSRRGCPAQHELPGRGTERAIRSRWSGHGAPSPRASNSLKRSLPRKHVSSIRCPVTSSASRLVLLNWPPPHHLWIGTKSRHFLLPQRVTKAAQASCSAAFNSSPCRHEIGFQRPTPLATVSKSAD